MCASHPGGFTLVELMIVLGVVAIASALAVPMLRQSDDAKLRAAAGALAADIDFARIDSITQGDAPRALVLDTVAHGYSIAPAATPQTPITNPVGKVPYRVVFGSGAAANYRGTTIQSVTPAGTTRLQFGVYGQLTSPTTTATVTLACGGRTIALSVDPATGEVSVGAIGP